MRNVKGLIVVTVVLITVSWMALDSAYFSPAAPQKPAAPSFAVAPAPAVTFTTLDGGSIDLQSLKGKKVLLNFWASWCAPCREEFPILFKRVTADENTVLLAVTADAKAADAEKFLMPLRTQFKAAFATNRIIIAHDPMGKIGTEKFQTYQYPETIIISDDGIMREKIVGMMKE